MTRETILELLERIQRGETSPEEGLGHLARLPYEDTGFAKIDHHRSLRLGLPEVIYSAGKTPHRWRRFSRAWRRREVT